MTNFRRIGILLILPILILSACKPQPTPPPSPTTDTGIVLTAAVATAMQRLTLTAMVTPTPLPSETPTITPSLPPITATATLPPVVDSPTPAPPSADLPDKVEFVDDITIKDGTDMAPGTKFTKTWRFKNIGTTTWTKAYTLVHVSDDAIDSPDSVPLPQKVAPGETVDISVDMTAPKTYGTHISYWKFKNDSGEYFGIGASGQGTIYVQIDVVQDFTPDASSTPGGGLLSNVILAIDDNNYTGSCPHTFGLTAEFSLSKQAKVTYELVGHSNSSGFSFNFPPAETNTFTAGVQTLVFSITFTKSGEGTIRFHISSPEDVYSNRVKFNLTCQ